jgi:iron complex outermembrane receptor protein
MRPFRFRALGLAAGVLFASPQLLGASPVTLHGTVVDTTQAPVGAVRVSAEGTAQATTTAADGWFVLDLPAAPDRIRLVVEHARFHVVNRELTPSEAAGEIRIVLTPVTRIAEEVTVTAARLDLPLSDSPAGTSVAEAETLRTMPRGIGAEEALATVPGVKVDNQADGERVHLSIRGQGILTERGIRGVQVLVDGVPLNDPSGFVPDLYDVDWMSVERIEVLRGPVAYLYGGGSSGGIIEIATRSGGPEPLGGRLWADGGSYGFWKVNGDAGGTSGPLNYHVSASADRGDGYREHTAFWGNKASGKLSWQVSPRVRLNALLGATGYFNENAEGLNIEQVQEDPRQANPDALTYNEYQKTLRQTAAVTGTVDFSSSQVLTFAGYFRHTNFTESVPSSVQHRGLDSPGLSAQYLLRSQLGGLRNTLSLGADFDRQGIDEHRHPNLGNAVEGAELLSDQNAVQRRLGGFVQDRLELSARWALLAGLRHDDITNDLTDNLQANGLDLSGSARFEKVTGRVAVDWNAGPKADVFASWGQGFQPPATEELYANPEALGGFNTGLVPATSRGGELGLRGSLGSRVSYGVSSFLVDTQNDFERYRIEDRPLETFYRNAGNSRRWGLETQLRWFPVSALTLHAAYTFNHFTYTSYDSVTYGSDLAGHWVPNSPQHQLCLEAEYRWKGWVVGVSDLTLSKAYVDATNATWIDGYSLLGARAAHRFKLAKGEAELYAIGRNITGTRYIAFTEPDPDGNSYHPGPTAEFFGGIQIRF